MRGLAIALYALVAAFGRHGARAAHACPRRGARRGSRWTGQRVSCAVHGVFFVKLQVTASLL